VEKVATMTDSKSYSADSPTRQEERFPFTRLPLSENALVVLARRYLLKDDRGKVVETPEDMFLRVAKAVAQAAALCVFRPAC
jgi:ribonucleotide reductase alpha subunit